MGMHIEMSPFTVSVPQTVLDDLQQRLARTRWPDEVEGTGWSYGTNRAYLHELVDYWQNAFDWRAQEEAINAFAHFRAMVDGVGIHFIHERGRGPAPLPLIITHGWPSSFVEMLKLIPLLTDPQAYGGDPADAFDVVVPSLPGYGFSDRPAQVGARSSIPGLWARLMSDGLGYGRFGAHGGDIGAGVTTRLGLSFSHLLVGIHVTAVADPYLGPDAPTLSAAEQAYRALVQRWDEEEGAYSHIQATRPQTLAYGLNDSPAGLAAWIVEKFRSWSDCHGDVERRFSKDELLTNVTLYWVTATINSSMRLYYESRHHPAPLTVGDRVTVPLTVGDRVTVPTGIALTTEAVAHAPREWAARTYNVQRWTELPRGGHFAALEEPALLAEDIRAFFRPLRPAAQSAPEDS